MKAKQLMVIALPLVVLAAGGLALACFDQASASSIEFKDVREQTKQFMAYEASIVLTPEQEEVFKEALLPLPAPCCSDNSALTCCCPCNLAKTWWGLAKHLIADQGFDAVQTRQAVEEWFEFINPDGFGGNVCPTGGCNRSFEHDGCGGMNANDVQF